MLFGIWKFLFGYVRMGVEGLSLGKLINRTLSEGIAMRSLKRLSYTRMETEMFAREYRRFVALSGDYPVKIRIKDTFGLPFLFKRAVGRLGLLTGLIALVVVLAALSQFILVVDVTGTENHEQAMAVRGALAGQGIYAGAFAAGIDVSRVENAVLRQLDELSYVGIRIRGMRVSVEAIPKKPVTGMVDRSAPCDIAAQKDAVVVAVNVMDGRAVAKPGDVVTAGEILVSGQVLLSDGQVLQKHAMAQVTGRVWYQGTASRSVLLETKHYTGRQWGTVCLVFPGGRWELYRDGEEEQYESWETVTERTAPMGKGFLLLVWIENSRVRETVTELTLLDFEEVLEAATDEATAQVRALIPEEAKIVDQTAGYRIDDDGVLTVEIFVETEEDIGTEVPFT